MIKKNSEIMPNLNTCTSKTLLGSKLYFLSLVCKRKGVSLWGNTRMRNLFFYRFVRFYLQNKLSIYETYI